jgi:hypothetical protein
MAGHAGDVEAGLPSRNGRDSLTDLHDPKERP